MPEPTFETWESKPPFALAELSRNTSALGFGGGGHCRTGARQAARVNPGLDTQSDKAEAWALEPRCGAPAVIHRRQCLRAAVARCLCKPFPPANSSYPL